MTNETEEVETINLWLLFGNTVSLPQQQNVETVFFRNMLDEVTLCMRQAYGIQL